MTESTANVFAQKISAESAGQAVRYDLKSIEAEGDAIIAAAKGRAREILLHARAALERIQKAQAELDAERARFAVEMAKVPAFQAEGRAKGREEGLVEGRAKGQEEGRAKGLEEGRATGHAAALDEARRKFDAERGEAARHLETMTLRIEAERSRIMAQAQESLVALSFEIARTVLRKEVATDPEAVRGVVAGAIEAASAAGDVAIAVNPEDRAIVERYLPTFAASAARGTAVRLVEDPAVDRGGCVLRSAAGEVDARIQVQLDELRRQLGV